MCILNITATSLMVNITSTKASSDSIRIEWSKPMVHPQFYSMNIACRLLWNRKNCRCDTFQTHGLRNFLDVKNLAPGTRCNITILAVYNPASKDNGITLTLDTLRSSKYRPS